MSIRLVEKPSVEPISLNNAKLNLRVDHTTDDARISQHISAAREWVEQRIQMEIAPKTWLLTVDTFPRNEIRLARGPVIEVLQVAYDDQSGLEQVIPPSGYWLDSSQSDGWLFHTEGWPATLDAVNTVRIQFRAGFEDATLIPQPIIAAIHLRIKALYDGVDTDVAVHNLLGNYYKMVA